MSQDDFDSITSKLPCSCNKTAKQLQHQNALESHTWRRITGSEWRRCCSSCILFYQSWVTLKGWRFFPLEANMFWLLCWLGDNALWWEINEFNDQPILFFCYRELLNLFVSPFLTLVVSPFLGIEPFLIHLPACMRWLDGPKSSSCRETFQFYWGERFWSLQFFWRSGFSWREPGRQGDPRRGGVKVVRGASPTGGPEEDKQAALYCSAGITQELSGWLTAQPPKIEPARPGRLPLPSTYK